MIDHTFHADWHYVLVPFVLTLGVIGGAIAYAIS